MQHKMITYRQYQNLRRKGEHPKIIAEYQDEKKVVIELPVKKPSRLKKVS